MPVLRKDEKMKKTLSILLLCATLLSLALLLVSCGGGNDGIPDGMQLVRGGEGVGYNFYVPEEWVVSNRGDISSAYVSVTNGSSVSLVEAPMPEETSTDAETISGVPAHIYEYYEREMAELPFPVETTSAGKKVNLGNADEAYSFVYTFTYVKGESEADYKAMQVYAVYGERFYVFTFLAPDVEYMDGKTYYEYFLTEKVAAVMDNIVFTAKSEGGDSEPEYVKDKDGYILVSDRVTSGFDLYVPDSFTPDYVSGIVSASDKSAGFSVNVSKITVNLGFTAYWELRQEELRAVADKTVDAEGKEVSTLTVISVDDSVTSHGGTQRVTMRYSYALEGKTYYVYQAYVRSTWSDYMYTFTSSLPLDSESSALALTILNKIAF